jgi:hypothetical protein
MEQFRGKYLVQNRVTGELYETPQMTYMLIAAHCFKIIQKLLDYNMLKIIMMQFQHIK